ncbi:uncharacterized protein BDW47DRAFT_78979 [Aspergillus candidus]|uniref:Uncharacterized protein n=1 Tax=Aspergillus candidus TaxID=41067 RepID=A0A2I2F155_ASPCN|nr:hypothetical protein BDW47DRAFT_78979 [Aspergillus candidus]PLB34347.1 hypothetical protein BDW47DRAFT_78979 [Aspergillus candidus]
MMNEEGRPYLFRLLLPYSLSSSHPLTLTQSRSSPSFYSLPSFHIISESFLLLIALVICFHLFITFWKASPQPAVLLTSRKIFRAQVLRGVFLSFLLASVYTVALLHLLVISVVFLILYFLYPSVF